MDPRRRDEGGEPGEELVGGEEKEERAATRALHPVDEPAVRACESRWSAKDGFTA